MFWPFGTNGIRNGLGTSLFIFALYFYERKFLMYAIMTLSFGMHNSLIIPIAAFVVSGIYKNPKVYLYIWLAAIPLSLIGGGFWESFFGFGCTIFVLSFVLKRQDVSSLQPLLFAGSFGVEYDTTLF